jgi:hypothetical protein
MSVTLMEGKNTIIPGETVEHLEPSSNISAGIMRGTFMVSQALIGISLRLRLSLDYL